MRIHLRTNKATQTIPYTYQQLLLGALHKWLGANHIHDDISLYSFSNLQGTKSTNHGFKVPHEATWFISMYDSQLLERCINGLKKDPEMFQGLKVQEIQLQQTPQFSSEERFVLASPVLVKSKDGQSLKHLTWKDGELANQVITQTLLTKLKKAGIQAKASVSFDQSYRSPKTKLITINNIQNRASYCPVIIKGDPEAIQFAWDVGIGHSTGSGFGAIC